MKNKTRINRLNQTERAIYLTIIILLFQITRNISNLVYIGFLFASYAWLYISYFMNGRKGIINIKRKFNLCEGIFLITLLWIPCISLVNMTNLEFLNSIPRYLVTLPFILFCAIYPKYDSLFINKALKLFIKFSVLAGGTIIFQMVFGPIRFFAEPSMRIGLVRYSSLAGSLTVMGSIGGIVLPFLLFTENELYGNKKKYTLILLLIIGMVTTLQKSAIINIIIVFIMYFIFYKGISIFKKILTVTLIIILLAIAYYIFNDTIMFDYIIGIYKYTFTSNSFGIKSDLLVRLWELPSRVISANNIEGTDYLFGIGFPALAGIMGNTQYPMAHNNFFDLLFSGGFFHLLSFVWILTRIPFNVIKKIITKNGITYLDKSYLVSSIVILSNMMIGAANFYQPVLATLIFFMIFSYTRISYRTK